MRWFEDYIKLDGLLSHWQPAFANKLMMMMMICGDLRLICGFQADRQPAA